MLVKLYSFRYITKLSGFNCQLSSSSCLSTSTIYSSIRHKAAQALGFPAPPKSPKNGFFLFKEDNAYKNATLSELTKEWHLLDDKTKEKFNKRFEEAKLDYKRQLKDYNSKLSEEDSLNLQRMVAQLKGIQLENRVAKLAQIEALNLGRPAVPKSPKVLFIENNFPHLNLNSDEAKAKWKDLSEADKQYYGDIVKNKKLVFKEELKIWVEKMQAIGREDLLKDLQKPKRIRTTKAMLQVE